MKRRAATLSSLALLFPALVVLSDQVGCTAVSGDGEDGVDNTKEGMSLSSRNWGNMVFTARPPMLVGSTIVADITYGSYTAYPYDLICDIDRWAETFWDSDSWWS